jgi:hypothetical protein
MTKECWLFLNCQVMTGKTPSQCPNYRHCKYNALNTMNRVCALPYHRFVDNGLVSLEVCASVQIEAIAGGWHQPVRLPYRYKPGYLKVGIFTGDLIPYLDRNHIEAGYDIAKDLPYIVLEHKQLVVKHALSQAQKEAGWRTALDLTYRRRKNPKRWEVFFDSLDPDYTEAIAAGWYPAESIDQEEAPW